MATFVPFLLQKSIEYLNQSPQNNQILRFIQILYKNLEWALDVDPEINHLPELKSEVDKLKSDEAARFMDKS